MNSSNINNGNTPDFRPRRNDQKKDDTNSTSKLYYIKPDCFGVYLEQGNIDIKELASKTRIPIKRLEALISGEIPINESEFRSISIAYCPEAPLPIHNFIQEK